MGRGGVARMFLFVGGIAAAFAWWGFAAQQTLLDPSATREAATGLLAAKPVQDSAITSLANQLVTLIPRSDLNGRVTEAQAHALAHEAATVALRDPTLRRAFADAIASMQQQLIDGNAKHTLTVNTAAVTAAVRNAITRADPQAAAHLPSAPLQLRFDTSHLPSLRGVDQHAGRITLIAALIAIAAWLGAVLVHPEPSTAIRVIGRRAVVIGALPLVFWVLIPAGLRLLHFGVADVVSPVASAYGQRLAAPAIAVVVIGAALWLLGRFNVFGSMARPGQPRQVPGVRRTNTRYSTAGSDTTDRLDRVDMRV